MTNLFLLEPKPPLFVAQLSCSKYILIVVQIQLAVGWHQIIPVVPEDTFFLSRDCAAGFALLCFTCRRRPAWGHPTLRRHTSDWVTDPKSHPAPTLLKLQHVTLIHFLNLPFVLSLHFFVCFLVYVFFFLVAKPTVAGFARITAYFMFLRWRELQCHLWIIGRLCKPLKQNIVVEDFAAPPSCGKSGEKNKSVYMKEEMQNQSFSSLDLIKCDLGGFRTFSGPDSPALTAALCFLSCRSRVRSSCWDHQFCRSGSGWGSIQLLCLPEEKALLQGAGRSVWTENPTINSAWWNPV